MTASIVWEKSHYDRAEGRADVRGAERIFEQCYIHKQKEKPYCLVGFFGCWWKEFELIRTMRSGWCFFKVEAQFVSAVYNVKYLKMDCLVNGYIQHLHRAFCLVNFDFASR